MSKSKQVFLLACFLIIGIVFILPAVHKARYMKAEGLSVDGVITHIEWKSSNHALPLFQIRNNDGSIYSLNDGELELKEGQINIGDKITKKAGARYCTINETTTECVSEFMSFRESAYKAINSP